MQNFMFALLTCSITMSAIALLYMAIEPLLSKRYCAKGRYYTWLIVIIGLIIPFRPQFDNVVVKVDIPPEMALPIIQMGNVAPITEPSPVTIPFAFLASVTVWQILVVVWLAGMVVFLVYHTIKHCRFVKLMGRWSEDIMDGPAFSTLKNLKTDMKITKQIGLQKCASIGSPMMVGFIYPKILLPRIDFTRDELRFILAHELVHYKRKDLWYKLLVLIASAIHWFNPIVYMVGRAIDIQCELSCDDEIVRSTDTDTRQHYSETIIGVVKHQSKMKTALSTNFYGGKKGMKNRIFSIMDSSNRKAGVAILCGAIILTMGTGFAFAANTVTPGDSIDNGGMVVQEKADNGSTDLSVYEACGMIFDANIGKYYYAGEQVRFFNDPIAGISFTNFYTGEVDIEAEYSDGNLIGLKYSTQEDYDRRTKRYSNIINSTTPIPYTVQDNNSTVTEQVN